MLGCGLCLGCLPLDHRAVRCHLLCQTMDGAGHRPDQQEPWGKTLNVLRQPDTFAGGGVSDCVSVCTAQRLYVCIIPWGYISHRFFHSKQGLAWALLGLLLPS